MILDGFGLNDKTEGNAVAQANKPNIDALMKDYPWVKGNASGLAVGLPDGQMGNSEVGHMNMGAGRIVYQELTRITKEIEDGDFFKNEALLAGMKNVKDNGSALHLYGLLSDGGVHSHITHLFGLLEMAKKEGVDKVYVHCFLDGRDTAPTSGKGFIEELEATIEVISHSLPSLAFYIVVFVILMSIELFVVSIKMGDTKCDYEMKVEYQLAMNENRLKNIEKDLKR